MIDKFISLHQKNNFIKNTPVPNKFNVKIILISIFVLFILCIIIYLGVAFFNYDKKNFEMFRKFKIYYDLTLRKLKYQVSILNVRN